jgi:hypothetical protein
MNILIIEEQVIVWAYEQIHNEQWNGSE